MQKLDMAEEIVMWTGFIVMIVAFSLPTILQII